MPLIRSEITRAPMGTEPPHDQTVNVVYHEILDGIFDPSVSYQSHADEIRTLFAGNNTGTGSTWAGYKTGNGQVKVYNMSDPKPRPVHAVSSWAGLVEPDTYFLPRLLAVCLSFYCGTNTPRNRGRIFLGPLPSTYSASEQVPSSLLAQILDLGHGLFDIGGENVSHRVWSVTDAASKVVSDYWVDSNWDAQHSRELKATTRLTLHP